MTVKKDYPSKQYINLAAKAEKQFNFKFIIPAIFLAVVLVLAVVKFGVIDRFAKVAEARSVLSDYQIQLMGLNSQLQNYDAVLEEYKRYSINWMDDSEKNLVMKTDIIDMVNSEILKDSEIRTLSVEDNTISVDLVGLTLTGTSELVERLQARDDVEDVQVFTATTEEAEENQVIVSVLVTMKLTEEGDAE